MITPNRYNLRSISRANAVKVSLKELLNNVNETSPNSHLVYRVLKYTYTHLPLILRTCSEKQYQDLVKVIYQKTGTLFCQLKNVKNPTLRARLRTIIWRIKRTCCFYI